MRTSICIATYDRPELLQRTLDSILVQSVPFCYEIIVVDDGSPDQRTRDLCSHLPVRYARIDREPGYRFNPAAARNLAYRLAVGEVIICQSDDVIHGEGTIRKLSEGISPIKFLIATVWNVDQKQQPVGLRGYGDRCSNLSLLTGKENPRPLFFLGSVYREDLYAVGGNDESLIGREDVFLADCLIRGLGLQPEFLSDVTGYHQDHERPFHTLEVRRAAAESYKRRVKECIASDVWVSRGGPWFYEGI